MPLLSTFGAGSVRGLLPRGWEANIQFFAIGGGGSAKYTSVTLPAGSSDPMLVVPDNAPAGTYRGNSSGYPGKIASNTEYVPLTSSQALRYPSAGTNTDGSSSSIKFKSGETYSVVIGAGGIAESFGGDTKLIKNGTAIVTAQGGAPADSATQRDGLVGNSYCGPSPWYTNVTYTYMYSKGVASSRPLGSNANDNTYKYIGMDTQSGNGNWGSVAQNSFGVSNGTQWNLHNAAETELIFNIPNGGSGGILCPILPTDMAQPFGGTTRSVSLARTYWDNQWYAPYIQYGYKTHWNYGAYGYYNAGYNWPYGLAVAGSSGISGGTFGSGGGFGLYGIPDTTGNGGTFVTANSGADGAFVLAYPASLPPLSSTTGLAGSASQGPGGYNILEVAGMTSNPQIITKNSVDYRVYIWGSSGSFTV